MKHLLHLGACNASSTRRGETLCLKEWRDILGRALEAPTRSLGEPLLPTQVGKIFPDFSELFRDFLILAGCPTIPTWSALQSSGKARFKESRTSV